MVPWWLPVDLPNISANTDRFEAWLVSIKRSFQGLSVTVETMRIVKELVEIWPNEVCNSCQAVQGWKWRCPLTFTLPSRLLCLGAMDSEWKILSNFAHRTCLGVLGCLQWNSTMSSGVETLEADSQELCSQPYPFYLMRYWNLLRCQWLSSISSTPHSADGDQREFDLETRVITNENIIIPKMFHSCALNK